MKTRTQLLVLCLLVFLDLVGFGILLPVQPFFADYFSASNAQITMLMGIYSVVQFVLATFWGRLSDRIGRKPVLIVSLVTSVLSYLLMAVAQSYSMLFVARIVSGMAAANISAAMAYAADVTEPKDRAKWMGMIGASIGMGFVLGPAIGAGGAWIGEAIGGDASRWIFVVPALLSAAMSAIALLGVVTKLPESLSAERRAEASAQRATLDRFVRFLKRPQTASTVTIMFLMTFAFAMMELTFALFVRDEFGYGIKATGMLMGVLGIAGVMTQGGLVRRMVPRMGEPKVIAIGAVFLVAGLALFSYAGAMWLFILACIALAAGSGLMQPSLTSHLSKIVDPGEHGGALGFGQGMTSLGRALPFWLAGALYDLPDIGRHAPYWLGAALVGACFVLSFSLRRTDEGTGDNER